MSMRVLTRTRLNAACQELARHRLSLGAAASLDLSRLADITAASQRIDLPALRELVSGGPVSMTLAALAPAPFATARSLLGSPAATANPQATATSARTALATAATAARAAISTATRDITAEAFAEAGAELGYTVSVCRGDVATGLELRQGHELVLMRVSDGGAVESDHAGLIDATCGDRQRELEAAAARRGVIITQRDSQDHASAQGGQLIRAAAARNDPSLARAIALDAQPPTAGARRTMTQEPGRRVTRRAGGSA